MTPEIAAAIESSPFSALGLIPPIVRALLDEGYASPTPVQREVVPHVLAARDVLACAQTGTGKTAAFVLPILQRLHAAGPTNGRIRVLVLTPTRELASQVAESVATYGRYLRIRHTVIYGGVSQHRQEVSLRYSPSVLVATPGRLLDLMQQGIVKLDSVDYLVLDEADRMLDMGFAPDVKRIAAAVRTERQTLLLSATMPPAIEQLARAMLKNPARVSVAPQITTAVSVEQSVLFVDQQEKRHALERLLRTGDMARTIVFTRTKHAANRLAEHLVKAGIQSAAIHGNKSQGARERALAQFRSGEVPVLVATDVAARGIDVDGVSHVVNYDLPEVAESYVHRIGRTGRAGAVGTAISFCDREERGLLRDIERHIKRKLPDVVMPGRADTQAAPSPAS